MTDATPEEMFLDSKLVGGYIRGLSKSAIEQPENEFRYANCLNREYSLTPSNISKVRFDISRYGKFEDSLEFSPPVSEKVAIEAVEAYLSRPLTKDYFEKIKGDMFHDNLPWDEAKEDYKCRGDCLTDCKFLEAIYLNGGEMTFFIGS